MKELQKRRPSAVWAAILAPGNHDCDFTADNVVRQTMIERAVKPDDAVIDVCTSVQRPYFEFEKKWRNDSRVSVTDSRLYRQDTFSIHGATITFHIINSAWVSRLHERQGQLFFPPEVLPAPASGTKPPDLSVAVFHHPYNWFEANNARDFELALDRMVDLIFTGHEHDADDYKKTGRRGATISYVEGGLLQDHRAPKHSVFNLLTIDLPEGDQTSIEFSWDQNKGIYAPREFEVPKLQRNRLRLLQEFEFSDGFKRYVKDPGTAFTHPREDPLTLRDIFVYPDFKEYDILARSELVSSIKQRSIVEYTKTNRHVFIGGVDRSGKTALAKILIEDYLKGGLVPILLNGSSLTKPPESLVRDALKKAVNEQYSGQMHDR